MAGFSDVEQRLCLGLALWNGRDPILKERMFGLTGAQANHGEDVKEYWWYLDAVPSHAWNRWRYHYPQAAFPYDDLHRRERPARQARPRVRAARHRRVRRRPLLDRRGRLRQGRSHRRDHGDPGHQRRTRRRHAPRAADGVVPQHVVVGRRRAQAAARTPRADGAVVDRPPVPRRARAAGRRRRPTAPAPTALFCENETNDRAAVRGSTGDAVPEGRDQRPRRRTARPPSTPTRRGRRRRSGTSSTSPAARPPRCGCACDRRAPSRSRPTALGTDLDRGGRPAPAEADEFYAEMTPPGTSADAGHGHAPGLRRHAVEQAALRLRRAALAGRRPDPATAAGVTAVGTQLPGGRTSTPSTSCRCPTSGSTRGSPPGTSASTASPWPTSTRPSPSTSSLLLCREWFQHPNGALPAYEWDFGDVNPPVQAWAALEVFAIDGARDLDFLSRVFDKLLVNFTWWVNLEDAGGNNLFEGGFLGLDNIGPLDRSHLPVGGTPRAVRRHRLDGVLRARHGGHRVDPQPLRPAPGDGPGAQVPRALRRDPPGDGHLRRVGRRRRASTTTSWSRRPAPPCRSRCGRWSASSRCSPRSCSTSTSWRGPRRWARASPGCSTTSGAARASPSRV